MKQMRQFEIFDGNAYQFTVMPSENPRRVLESERRYSRNPRLRMVMVENGQRIEVEGPSEPEREEEEISFEEYADEA